MTSPSLYIFTSNSLPATVFSTIVRTLVSCFPSISLPFFFTVGGGWASACAHVRCSDHNGEGRKFHRMVLLLLQAALCDAASVCWLTLSAPKEFGLRVAALCRNDGIQRRRAVTRHVHWLSSTRLVVTPFAVRVSSCRHRRLPCPNQNLFQSLQHFIRSLPTSFGVYHVLTGGD